MAKALGPIEVICDAPPYSIVRACRLVGVEKPEDVPWRQTGHYLEQRGYGVADRGHRRNEILMLLGTGHVACSCGRTLPTLTRYHFTFSDATTSDYLIGQCSRCKAVYWEKL